MQKAYKALLGYNSCVLTQGLPAGVTPTLGHTEEVHARELCSAVDVYHLIEKKKNLLLMDEVAGKTSQSEGGRISGAQELVPSTCVERAGRSPTLGPIIRADTGERLY